jgi:ribosome-associated protein
MTPPRKAAASRRFPAQVQRAIAAAQDRKAVDVVVLDLRPANGFADYFLVCSGTNPRQIKAISDSIQEALAERGIRPAHVEGYDRAGWILLDYFDFIVHIFSPDARAFYALERLWGNAKKTEIAEPAPPAARTETGIRDLGD